MPGKEGGAGDDGGDGVDPGGDGGEVDREDFEMDGVGVEGAPCSRLGKCEGLRYDGKGDGDLKVGGAEFSSLAGVWLGKSEPSRLDFGA